MTIIFKIKENHFHDALNLMRISKDIRESVGVKNAVAVMATEKGKFALEDAGLMTPTISAASGSDLLMVVEADSEEAAKQALEMIEELVSQGVSQSALQPSSDILHQDIKVINMGLEIFKEALETQGVEALHVNWQVPANGKLELIDILKKMY